MTHDPHLAKLAEAKKRYRKGVNSLEFLKALTGLHPSSTEMVLMDYDLQAGTYVEAYRTDPGLREFKRQSCSRLAGFIGKLGGFRSLLEVGVGEATTLGPLMLQLPSSPERVFGFDVSWSRIKYARQFLAELALPSSPTLVTGDLFCAPFKDSSIDIVYTSHSIEPNGGREREALIELYRIARRYLVLLEPSYHLGGPKAKEAIVKHGYVTQLYSTAIQLGYKVIEYSLFEDKYCPTNPTEIIMIEKETEEDQPEDPLACPISKSTLVRDENVYYSPESMLAYPILQGIPCLLPWNAVVAVHWHRP